MPEIPGELIRLNELDNIQPGDDLRIEVSNGFYVIGTAVQAAIEGKLRSDPRLDLYDWKQTGDSMIYSVRVVELPASAIYDKNLAGVLTPAVIIAAIVGVAAIFTSITVYKTVNSPGGTVLSTSLIAIAVIVSLVVFWKAKP